MYHVTASWVPSHTPHVIRRFPLCGVKVPPPRTNYLTRPLAMVTAKKQNNGTLVVSLTQWLARFTASLPTDANPTDIYWSSIYGGGSISSIHIRGASNISLEIEITYNKRKRSDIIMSHVLTRAHMLNTTAVAPDSASGGMGIAGSCSAP